jgi:hypothetical protein
MDNSGAATSVNIPLPDNMKGHPGYPPEVTYEKEYRKTFSKSMIKDKIEQFKLGKYTDKYIRTYLEFVLMEGIIDNLTYLEHLKEIGSANA